MTRRNLDGFIYGDRADVRDFKVGKLPSNSLIGLNSGTGQRCYHSHKPLQLPGSGLVIHGGSCITPAVKDAGVYIGFDYGMTFSGKQYPWRGSYEFLFEIQDMRAPADAAEFKKLVAWTIEQLQAGKKVHAGCIGGHGRTGTFLSALVATLGEKNATEFVRTHYCSKAVESTEQIKFLAKHFGVLESHGTKALSKPSPKPARENRLSADPVGTKRKATSASTLATETFTPLRGGSIWD